MKKIGVIGLGFMGKMHLLTYAKIPEARVVAVSDADKNKLSENSLNAGGNIQGNTPVNILSDSVRRTCDPQKLIDDPEVDIVDICLPTPLHKRYVLAALRAGKHVLCEKPLSNNAKDGKEMIEAAKKSKKMFMVAHCIRFWPEYVKTKEIIDSGKYGKVVSAAFFRQSAKPCWSEWILDGKQSGGAALDLHIHDTDFIHFLFGKPNSVVSTGANKVSKNGGFDYLMTLYDYGTSKAVASEGTWAMEKGAPFNMSFRIILQNATLRFNIAENPTLSLYVPDGQILHPEVEKADGYFCELKHFIECVEKGETRSAVAAPEGSLMSLLISLKEIESVQKRRTVKV